MFYLLANEKFVKYTRIGIYAAGAFLLALFFYINVFQIETNSYMIKNDGSFPMPNFYQLPTNRPASELKMELNFKEDNVDSQNLQVFASRTHAALFRKRNQMIFEPEKLKELTDKDTLPDYPSGTLVSVGKTVYLINENSAMPFSSEKVLNRFGFNRDKIKEISEETLSQFEPGDSIDVESLKEENFPSGIIIRTDNSFFLTGDKRIFPIFSEDIIRQAWPDYHYINAGSMKEAKMERLDCFFTEERKIVCQKDNPAQDAPGSEYALSIQGITLEKLDSVRVQTVFIPTWNYILTQLKELFW